MAPAELAKLFSLLERIAVALEKGGSGASGGGGGAGWRSMKVPAWAPHNKGAAFGDLDDKGLAFWVSRWFPKPFTKSDGGALPPKAVDVALRRALDEAAKELGLPLPPGYTPETQPNAKESPVSARSSAPPPQSDDDNDENLPF
jgi:hypothetical protein